MFRILEAATTLHTRLKEHLPVALVGGVALLSLVLLISVPGLAIALLELGLIASITVAVRIALLVAFLG